MLYELLYTSVATKEMGREELLRMLAKCRVNNRSVKVTGMLVYHNGEFMQLIEGEEVIVKDLFKKIKKDKRHHTVKSFWESPIAKRGFADFRMGFVNTGEDNMSDVEGYANFFEEGFSTLSMTDVKTDGKNFLIALSKKMV